MFVVGFVFCDVDLVVFCLVCCSCRNFWLVCQCCSLLVLRLGAYVFSVLFVVAWLRVCLRYLVYFFVLHGLGLFASFVLFAELVTLCLRFVCCFVGGWGCVWLVLWFAVVRCFRFGLFVVFVCLGC